MAVSITEEFPTHQFAWKLIGAVFEQSGRKSEALSANQKSVQLAPQDAEAHNNLGNTLRELGRLDEAEASFTKGLALKPDYVGAHHNLGNTLQELGRLDEAEASYRKAAALRPDLALTHYNLGNTLKELDRLNEAEASYGQAIALKPDFSEAHSNLGNVLRELGRFDESEVSLTKALASKPDFVEAHSNLGVLLQELGRLDEAEARYRQAIALKPDFTEAHYNLGNTLKELGRLEEAEASLKNAIALKSDYAEAHLNLGNTLKELDRLEEAEASYRQVVALKPDHTEAMHMIAALSGDTTATAPLDYVEGVFDNYAAKFESSLIDNLEYETPKVIAEMIKRNSKSTSLGSIMDLGCGTGLFGAEIKQFCEYLTGIDISKKMLDEAKGKNVYNKLLKQDIVTYLSKESFNFDYFIATDVFVYIGDLSDVFRLIKAGNKTSGKLAFSTEHYNGDDFILRNSGRYAHSKTYINSLCEKFGLKMSHFESRQGRKERAQFIKFGLYLLDF